MLDVIDMIILIVAANVEPQASRKMQLHGYPMF